MTTMRLAAILLAALVSFGSPGSKDVHADTLPAAGARVCATVAAPRTIEYPWMSVARWNRMFADQAVLAEESARNGGVDVMFVGDSITEGWPKPIWDASFGRFRPANFGIGGDHTGNLLWRLRDSRIAGLRPKVVVVLIGVNNFGHCNETPAQVFSGIEAVVATLRSQYPAARVLLNAVLPADQSPASSLRAHIVELNKMVATLDDGKNVVVHDYGALLTRPDGSISAEIMPDFLHLTPKGYRIWADAMRPDIALLLDAAP
jgi:lysophospholipase L1-like esterase